MLSLSSDDADKNSRGDVLRIVLPLFMSLVVMEMTVGVTNVWNFGVGFLAFLLWVLSDLFYQIAVSTWWGMTQVWNELAAVFGTMI